MNKKIGFSIAVVALLVAGYFIFGQDAIRESISRYSGVLMDIKGDKETLPTTSDTHSTPTSPQSPQDAGHIPQGSASCAPSAGAKFVSSAEQSGGLSPQGGSLSAYWHVSFAASSLTWTHSDVVESAPFSCASGKIKALIGGENMTGTYNAQTGILVWGGIEYKKESAEGAFCGGIAGIACPAGYECRLEGTHPDAGGTCAKE
jgi:hypothetical protein